MMHIASSMFFLGVLTGWCSLALALLIIWARR